MPKNDPKVEVCVNEQSTILGHVYTLGGSETTFYKIVTHIGGLKKPKNPRNFLKNRVFSLLRRMGLEESLDIIYSYCRTWRYRLNDVEISKIQTLFHEL